MVAHSSQREEDLVRRVQHGDDGAFDYLVELCAPQVYSLAFRLSGNADDAQDLAQEAFVRAYTAIHRFKGESAFSTWLYRIVANVCHDEFKRRKRRAPVLSEFEADDGPSLAETLSTGESAEDRLLQHERQQAVQAALLELPEPMRLVIVLYDLQGFSYQEIADILQQNIGTVKSRLNRARNTLREILSSKRELFDLAESQSK